MRRQKPPASHPEISVSPLRGRLRYRWCDTRQEGWKRCDDCRPKTFLLARESVAAVFSSSPQAYPACLPKARWLEQSRKSLALANEAWEYCVGREVRSR